MLKKLLIAAAGLMISVPVLAQGWHYGHYRHYPPHFRHYPGYYEPYRPVVFVRPPVYYAIRLNFPL